MVVSSSFKFGEGKEIVMVHSCNKSVLLRNMKERWKCALGLLFSEFSQGFVKRHCSYLNKNYIIRILTVNWIIKFLSDAASGSKKSVNNLQD